MKTLLLDVDDVLVCCASQVHHFAQCLLGRELPHWTTWTAFEFEKSMGLTLEEAELFFASAEHARFCNFIDFYTDTQKFVYELKKHYDVCFVTAPWKRNKYWVLARDSLLEEFDLPIIYASQKWRVRGDMLVDDKPATLLDSRATWTPIVFDQPWNREITGIRRIHSLEELLP